VFEERYVGEMQAARRDRLSPAERAEFEQAVALLNGGAADDPAFATLARLGEKTDAYDPVESPEANTRGGSYPGQARIYAAVWPEAAAMRADGRLRAAVEAVTCPVVAIHGNDDPSPAAGVRGPLARWQPGARFRLLERCGHTPWRERQARAQFFAILNEELDAE
jgi:pimeloyl-ACP methyl ester carboxylesterase